MSVPTKGEKYAELMDLLRRAQDTAAMLGHLTYDEDRLQSKGWLGVSEMLGNVCLKVSEFARRGMH